MELRAAEPLIPYILDIPFFTPSPLAYFFLALPFVGDLVKIVLDFELDVDLARDFGGIISESELSTLYSF